MRIMIVPIFTKLLRLSTKHWMKNTEVYYMPDTKSLGNDQKKPQNTGNNPCPRVAYVALRYSLVFTLEGWQFADLPSHLQ